MLCDNSINCMLDVFLMIFRNEVSCRKVSGSYNLRKELESNVTRRVSLQMKAKASTLYSYLQMMYLFTRV